MDPLPFVDEHSRAVRGGVEATFDAVLAVASGLARRRLPRTFVRAWDLRPRSGFAIAEVTPAQRVVLRGAHRFSTYELEFLVEQTRPATVVRARTRAEFPGLWGTVYRSLVIGSRGHVLAVRQMLRDIDRRSAGT